MKKITSNIIFNVIRNILNIVTPIIIFTISAHYLSIEDMGKVSFAKNFTSYFCLIASLGVSYYGIREGARKRKNLIEFSEFFQEIFVINLISTLIAFFIFIFSVFFVNVLFDYRILLIINSVSIFLSGLTFEWAVSSFEEFKFLSVVTMFVQICSLLMTVLFMNKSEGSILYTVILIFSSYGTTIFNVCLMIKKGFFKNFSFSKKRLIKHLKPIFILFAMLLSIDLYTLLDTTMLGIIKGDAAVGRYSVAIKIPRLVNSIIASIGVVLVPKLSLFYDSDKERFFNLLHFLTKIIFMLSVPCAIGLFFLSPEILYVLCGAKYVDTHITLKILSFITLIIPISVLYNNQVFIPMRREILVLKSTCVGAITNMIFNFILIPVYSENGAAIATVVSELFVMIVCLYHVKKELSVSNQFVNYMIVLRNAMFIIPILVISRNLLKTEIAILLIAILFSIVLYVLISFKYMKNLLLEYKEI